MANWEEYLNRALNRLKKKPEALSLPQLVSRSLAVSEEAELVDEHPRKREEQVKDRSSYTILENMRRRLLSWKSYFYQDKSEILKIAIINDDAIGIHINERKYLVPEENIIDGNFFIDNEVSEIYLTSEYFDNVPEELFNRLQDSEVRFQIYEKTLPLQILFPSDMEGKKGLFLLGHHKIYVKDNLAYLLRPFRNLGASGFYALTKQMLIQEGIPIDKKGFVESLLIELGNDELLKSYQSALNRYNRQSIYVAQDSILDDNDSPLIITDTKKKWQKKGLDLAKRESIPYESYELFIEIFKSNFEELDENLLKISMAAVELDRIKVSEELSILSDKLHKYMEETMLEDLDPAGLYNFLETFPLDEDKVEKIADYSLLEDDAYEQILMETIESIQEIYSDPRYTHYAPIRDRLDGFTEVMESLDNALQDATEKHKRRKITDRREILLKKPFELHDRSYDRELEADEMSYYDKLLKVNEEIGSIKEQMKYAVYDVAKDLAIAGYLLTLLRKTRSPELDQLSNKLLLLAEMQPSDNYASFVDDFVKDLADITSEIHEVIGVRWSDKLALVSANLASFHSSDKIFSEQDWPADYKEFIDNEATELIEEIRVIANKRHSEIREKISYQHSIINIFVSAVAYPALLPATLHEEGKGLQTYLVQCLQEYLATKNLRLHTVPGRERELRPLINELMPVRLNRPLKELEYYFRLS